MTLYDYIKEHPDIEELPVHDKEYDMESYFYTDILNPEDEWDKAMARIAKKLNVVKIENEEDDFYQNYGYTAGVTVDLSDLIERNIDNGVFEKLFIHNDIDSIMDDIASIFSGYVSEQWLTDFAESLDIRHSEC